MQELHMSQLTASRPLVRAALMTIVGWLCVIPMNIPAAEMAHAETSSVEHHDHAVEMDDHRTDTIYSCPMHPQETSHEPGRCKICGMFLVAQSGAQPQHNEEKHIHRIQNTSTNNSAQHKTKRYWDGGDKHPETQPDHAHPAEPKLPTISKRLNITQESDEKPTSAHEEHDHSEHNHQPGSVYVCPMHPQIVRHKPGESCPICGMDLVLKESAQKARNDQQPQVFLNSTTIQNMGVRTTKALRSRVEKSVKTQGIVTADDLSLIHISEPTRPR